MEIKFKTAPHIRQKLSTNGIMFHLTIGLLIVFAFGVYNVYSLYEHDMAYVTNALVLLATSVVVALVTEGVWALATKNNVLSYLKNSFGWVTAIILTLMVPVNTEPYALGVATFIAIFFAKLVFGGFGQNVFNPAAVGRAIIFAAFAGSVSADLVTTATPTTTIASSGWMLTAENFATFLNDFGGFGGLFLGTYAGAIGETGTLVILLVGVYLAFKEVIDWRVPVTYLGVIFVSALIIGAMNGVALEFALFNVLTGGAVFGAVFMLTDPVTNPNTRAGRIVFATVAAFFTMLIRYMANLPEGVLYSILLANILTPVIDKYFDGKQVLREKKNNTAVIISVLVGVIAISLVGTTLTPAEKYRSINVPDGKTVTMMDDLSKYNATLVSQDGNTYVIEVDGFGLLPENKEIASYSGHTYSPNTITVEVDPESGAIVSIEFTEFGDTTGFGDVCMEDEFLGQFSDLTLDGEVNCVSGATYTSESVIAAAQLALNGGMSYEKGGEIALNSDFSKYKAEVTDNGDGSYHVTVLGFGMLPENKEIASYSGHTYSRNEFDITISDGKVTSVVFATFGDTTGFGDKCMDEAYLESYVDKGLNDSADLISSSTYTSESVAAAVNAALNAANN